MTVARCHLARRVLLGGAVCLFGSSPDPCRANPGPQGGLLFSWSVWEGEVPPPIRDCHEIVRSTPHDGLSLFVLYFMGGPLCAFPDLCVVELNQTITWPAAWQILQWGVYGDGTMDFYEGNLSLEWDVGYPISEDEDGVIPLAAFLVNVVGPGQFGFGGDLFGEVRLGECTSLPNSFTCGTMNVYAEAGMECGYISSHCADKERGCDVEFQVPELVLTAPVEATADSTIEFNPHTIWAYHSFVVDSHVPWCTASAESIDTSRGLLNVAADATGLLPGRYDTWVELSNDSWGVSRCLPVGFVVEQTTATVPEGWGGIKALYR
jgi:hypothetical protein